MLNLRLAKEYIAYLIIWIKYAHPTPLWIVAVSAVMTTYGFHALAAYEPDEPFWWMVIANTLVSGGVSLVVWGIFSAVRLKDASLRWCLAWMAVAATTSLMLAASQ